MIVKVPAQPMYALIIRVTKTGGETALAQIVKLVDQGAVDRLPVQKLADQIAAVFVPAVLGNALDHRDRLVRVGNRITGPRRQPGRLSQKRCAVS